MPILSTFSRIKQAFSCAINMALETLKSGWSSSAGKTTSSAVDEVDEEFYDETVRDLVGSRGSVEVQILALIGVFAAGGLVPAEEAIFAALVTAYAMLLSWKFFPTYPKAALQGEACAAAATSERERRCRKILWRRKAYVGVGLAVELLLPLGFSLGGFSRGNPAPARAASAHLFLVLAQLLSQLSMTRNSSRFCAPLRLIVALLYSARRLYALLHWLRLALSASAAAQDDFWILFGRCLVVANIIYCNINVFGVVIPRLLLRAFERYIGDKNAYYASSSND